MHRYRGVTLEREVEPATLAEENIMQVPLQITIRDIGPSEAVKQRIRQKAEKLNLYSGQIISCHVVVQQIMRHKHQGKLYNVRINLTLPKKELVVNRNEQEDLYVAIRDAFDDMARKTEEAARKLQGDVKLHPNLMHGHVVRIFKDNDFGFIESEKGDEYYFNAANVVHPNFNKIEVGTQVHFIEVMGDEGLQAHRVSTTEHKV